MLTESGALGSYFLMINGNGMGRSSKETSKLCVIGICEGNLHVTDGFPHKGPVTRKMFPFDDVIMRWETKTNKTVMVDISKRRHKSPVRVL